MDGGKTRLDGDKGLALVELDRYPGNCEWTVVAGWRC